MRTWMVVIALGILPPSAWAQTSDGPRWSGWIGCWNVRMDATRGTADGPYSPPDRSRAARVCVAAEGDAATITTEVNGTPALTQQLVADGTERPFTDGVCTGVQQVDWSVDRRRLFSRARLTCAQGNTRTVSGLSLVAPDGTWIEAQSIEAGDRSSLRVRRFVREDRTTRAAPDVHRLTTDDVTEASARVAGPALEAALVESRSTFALTARRLMELDEAGVPPSVIDVMVALTFPQAFSLRPAARADRLTPFPFDVESSDPTYSWWLPTAEAGGYFDSAYFMSPFGYSSLGSYPMIFGVQGGGGGGGGGGRGNRGTRDGRVINGLGYTRMTPRDAQSETAGGHTSSSARSGSRGTATTRGYTRGAEAASGTASGGGTSGGNAGGGSSSSGSASGSSDGGRTAVDR